MISWQSILLMEQEDARDGNIHERLIDQGLRRDEGAADVAEELATVEALVLWGVEWWEGAA